MGKAARLLRRVRRGLNKRGTRLWNAQVARRFDLVPRATRVPRFFIELTNHCNLVCSMCPRPTLQRELGHMDWELYRDIIDRIGRLGGYYVGLNRFGESLLYPRFIEAVGYAKQAGINQVAVVTNGTRLTEETASQILESGLDQLLISLDSLDRESYESSRRGAKLDQVVANVDRLLELRRQRGLSRPRVIINSVMVEENVARLRPLFTKYYGLADRIDLKPCARYGDGQDLPGEGTEEWRPRTCTQPWDRMNIFWNGDATVCCGDVEGELIVGNVQRASLEWLWLHSPRVREIRRLHHRHQFESLPVCRRCDATNAVFFSNAVQQLIRVYGALGLGDVVQGLANTSPMLKWPGERTPAGVASGQAERVSADDLEP